MLCRRVVRVVEQPGVGVGIGHGLRAAVVRRRRRGPCPGRRRGRRVREVHVGQVDGDDAVDADLAFRLRLRLVAGDELLGRPEPTGAAAGRSATPTPDTGGDDDPRRDDTATQSAAGRDPETGTADEVATDDPDEDAADQDDAGRVAGPSEGPDDDPDADVTATDSEHAATDATTDPDDPPSVDGDDVTAADGRTVPSLDPERSGRAETGAPDEDGDDAATAAATDDPSTASDAGGKPGPGVEENDLGTGSRPQRDPGVSSAALDELRNELRRLREAHDRLDRRVAALESASDADPAVEAVVGLPEPSQLVPEFIEGGDRKSVV